MCFTFRRHLWQGFGRKGNRLLHSLSWFSLKQEEQPAERQRFLSSKGVKERGWCEDLELLFARLLCLPSSPELQGLSLQVRSVYSSPAT